MTDPDFFFSRNDQKHKNDQEMVFWRFRKIYSLVLCGNGVHGSIYDP